MRTNYGSRKIKSLDAVLDSAELKALQAEPSAPKDLWERKKAQMAAKEHAEACRRAARARALERQRAKKGIYIGPNGGKYRIVNGRKRYDVA